MSDSPLEQAVKDCRLGPTPALRRRVLELLLHASVHAQAASRPKPEGGGELSLAVSRRPDGSKAAAAFSTRERARGWNNDANADWIEVPAAFVMREALRAGAELVLLDPPSGLELGRDEFAPLAEGRLPEEKKPAAKPPPPMPAAPAPAKPEEPTPTAALGLPSSADAVPASPRWKFAAPEEDIPEEALEYLRHVLEIVDEVTEAWFFTAKSGDESALVLGLRIDLPPAQWDELIGSLEQLQDVPGFPDGLAVSALTDETLQAVKKCGLQL